MLSLVDLQIDVFLKLFLKGMGRQLLPVDLYMVLCVNMLGNVCVCVCVCVLKMAVGMDHLKTKNKLVTLHKVMFLTLSDT